MVKKSKKKQYFRFRLLPVIAFTALVLLIVRARSYSIDLGELSNTPYSSGATMWDCFSYAKAQAVLFISVWAALTMAYLLITGQMKLKKTPIYIPMLVYTGAVLLSYIMSEHPEVAWNGSVERFEGTRTILCYMFMLFYAINVVEELREGMIVAASALIAAVPSCLIGISQLTWNDFFLTKFGSWIVAGGQNISVRGNFYPWQVYQTVQNMNYVGMYLALLVPMLLYLLYYYGIGAIINKSAKQKSHLAIIAFSVLFLGLIGVNLYGAKSLGGVMGIGVGTVILMMVLCEKRWVRTSLAVLCLVGFVGAFAASYVMGADAHRQVDYIETGLDRVDMSVNGIPISIVYDREVDRFLLFDGKNKPIEVFGLPGEDEVGRFQVDQPDLVGEIVIIPFKNEDGIPCVIADVRDGGFGFVFHEDGTKYRNPYGEEVSLVREVESIGFEGHLSAGSTRGYIWSRTLPLLKSRLLVGSGADTFLLYFPHGDYAGKYSAGIPVQSTCDKPHSMYLDMAVGTGMISLIAFLVMIAMAMWQIFRLGKDKVAVKVIAAGILGFLAAGLVNDSSVNFMPMFYGLLGSAIGIGTRGADDLK